MALLSYYELLLCNLRGDFLPNCLEYIPKNLVYERLRVETGQDFGYDVAAWAEWMRDWVPFTEMFGRLLDSLREDYQPGDASYIPKQIAYERLKGRTGEDFGFDVDMWRRWLWANRQTWIKGREFRFPSEFGAVSSENPSA